MIRRQLIAALCIFLCSPLALAQNAPAPASDKTFTQEELDQLLAPIALYPDSLLSQTLMASTYALEVVQAQRWADSHKNLKGDPLAKELEKLTWDPSVKSLINFPQVLQMMSQKLDWTVQLGNAFLSQQKDVMETVQKLRAKAKGAGNLNSTEQQKVSVDSSEGSQVIIIESAQPDVVYVPVYDPTIIYGTWWYPAYPPYYWYPPYYRPAPGLYFGAGFAIGVAWGYSWGHCDWHHTHIDIDVNRNTNINRNIDRGKYATQYDRTNANIGGKSEWRHDPTHRKGTPYPNKATARQFNQATQARDSYRGFDNQPVGSGQSRVGNVDRPGAANLPANNRQNSAPVSRQQTSGARTSAYDGVNQGAAQTRMQSDRGRVSSGAAPSRPAGGAGYSRPAGGGGGRR